MPRDLATQLTEAPTEDNFWHYPFTWHRVLWWTIKLVFIPIALPLHIVAQIRERGMLKAMRRAQEAGYAGFRYGGETYKFWKP